MADDFWTAAPEQVFGDLARDYANQVRAAIERLLLWLAPQIEGWMKGNAPWEDRTGNARQALYTLVARDGSTYVLVMDHGVQYGYWLEVIQGGRYAIVAPAMDYAWTLVLSNLRSLFA